jgi:hypothetical protein
MPATRTNSLTEMPTQPRERFDRRDPEHRRARRSEPARHVHRRQRLEISRVRIRECEQVRREVVDLLQ